MLNGNMMHWFHEHLPTIMASASAVRHALPVSEMIKIAVVAIVTALLTAMVTIARLEEKINAIQDFRHQQIARRNLEVDKIERDVAEIKRQLLAISVQLARLESRK